MIDEERHHDRRKAVDSITGFASDKVKPLHPTDRVEVLRQVAEANGRLADAIAEDNDKHGLPEEWPVKEQDES